MKPERWQRIEKLFHTALEREPSERAAFLARECAGDLSLRREIESLLASHDRDGRSLDAADIAADLFGEGHVDQIVGRTLGPYKILKPLGRGGMGAVFLAEDVKLARRIALKVLPAEFTRDRDRLRRFEQEARAVSALNHPNIVTIYDSGDSGDLHFIAMEFVDGVTLRERLASGRLKLGEALDIASQVASALAAAHAAGIVHRDIKPENILLRRDGYIKVLDFGLAKLTILPATTDDAHTESQFQTAAGIIVGTPHYMSPEQVRGAAPDTRTDIFSFGAVFYEMLSGRRAFQAATAVEAMNAILNEDPPDLHPEIPPPLQRIVRRCLEKQPEKRFQSAEDLAFTLRALATDSQPGMKFGPSPAGLARSSPRWAWYALAVALLVLIGAGLAVVLPRRERPAEQPAGVQTPTAIPLTTYPGSETYPTLSPDASQVAFSWNGPDENNEDIYVKLVGPGEPHRLTTDPASDFSPAWSPDGRQIAFLRRPVVGNIYHCGIYSIPALGGGERRLAEIDLTTYRFAASGLLAWTPDGKWLAASGRFGPNDPSEIWLLSPETGEWRRLSVAAGVLIGDIGLSFSPDGRFLAFLRFLTHGTGDVYLLPLDSGYATAGKAIRLTSESLSPGGPCWMSHGTRILYSSGGTLGYRTLRGLLIDPAHPERRVDPVPFATGENATMLASARNRLVYAREQRDTNIWQLQISTSGAAGRPSRLIASTFNDHNPDYSPDGKMITFTSTRSGSEEIWIASADGSNPVQMTSVGGASTSNSRWSRDGRTIVFNSRRTGSSDLFLLEVATGSVRPLTDDPNSEFEPRWSRDGNWIYFASHRGGRTEVWKIPADGGTAVQVTRQGGGAAFESADGRWLYYSKGTDSPTSIWRVPVEGGKETKVLDGLSYNFNFAVTGKGIYLLALRGRQLVPSVEFFEFATLKTTVLHTLDRPSWYGFALAPDESSILFSQVDSLESDLMLVENLR